MEIIVVRGLSLKIGKTQILTDVNVGFQKGQIHGLIGRNGSGKTILIASHSSEDIKVLCDTVSEMNKGILVRLDAADNET